MFPPGERRDHFLALAIPEKVAEMKSEDASIFQPADYGSGCGTLMSYPTSAAWTWMVYDSANPRIIGYNDV